MASRASYPLPRERNLILASLLVLAAAAWALLVWQAGSPGAMGMGPTMGLGAPLFLAIRLAGAAYLVYLGARSVLKAIRRRGASNELATPPGSHLSSRSAFVQGFLSNLSNAKMVAFFISLLPPFAGPHPSFLVLLGLGLNFSLLTLAWLVGYAFAVERMGRWLRRSLIRRALDGILGAVLVALGVRVGAEAIAR